MHTPRCEPDITLNETPTCWSPLHSANGTSRTHTQCNRAGETRTDAHAPSPPALVPCVLSFRLTELVFMLMTTGSGRSGSDGRGREEDGSGGGSRDEDAGDATHSEKGRGRVCGMDGHACCVCTGCVGAEPTSVPSEARGHSQHGETPTQNGQPDIRDGRGATHQVGDMSSNRMVALVALGGHSSGRAR
jgi:hypothetical protein